jgi:hypothetical protein
MSMMLMLLSRLLALSDLQLESVMRIEADIACRPSVPGRGLYAAQYSIDDIRKATGVGAEVVENCTLKVTLEASPDFLAKVKIALNALRSSGAPASGSCRSTGRSMPAPVIGAAELGVRGGEFGRRHAEFRPLACNLLTRKCNDRTQLSATAQPIDII